MEIMVLGVNRSGTSLTARIIHNMGIFMGFSLLEGDELNPAGYYEDTSFLDLNKEILAYNKRTWYNVRNVNEILSSTNYFYSKIADLVASRAIFKNWGWKDPRNCYTCWMFAPHCYNLRVVIVERNQADVIASNMRGYNLTELQVQNAVSVMRNSYVRFLKKENPKHIRISYDRLIDPKQYPVEIQRLGSFLGLDVRPRRFAHLIRFK